MANVTGDAGAKRRKIKQVELLRIYLTLGVKYSANTKGSFSILKQIKTDTGTTMTEHRLNSLALLVYGVE